MNTTDAIRTGYNPIYRKVEIVDITTTNEGIDCNDLTLAIKRHEAIVNSVTRRAERTGEIVIQLDFMRFKAFYDNAYEIIQPYKRKYSSVIIIMQHLNSERYIQVYGVRKRVKTDLK